MYFFINEDGHETWHTAGALAKCSYTIQTFDSCTGRPDFCQCPVVQIPMNQLSKKGQAHQRPTYLANQNYVQFWGQWPVVASMTRKLGGNRACGRVFCPAAHAFSAGIKCRHCIYNVTTWQYRSFYHFTPKETRYVWYEKMNKAPCIEKLQFPHCILCILNPLAAGG